MLVLGLMGGILVFALLLTHQIAVPPASEPPPPTVEADELTASATSEFTRGNTAHARQLLAKALAKAPRHAPALLLKTCIALESGPPREAEAALALLREAEPQRPEPRLLQRLLEHRARAPEAGWRRPFLKAWTELGRPSFVDSPLLPAIDLEAPELLPTDAWEHATSPPMRLTLVLARHKLSEPSARWLVEHLPTVEDAALVQAASVRLLASTLPPTLRLEARATVRRRLERLVEAAPDLLQPRLLLLLAQASEWGAFSQQELASLEAIASRPTWQRVSFLETFLEARAHLHEARHPSPGVSAFTMARISANYWGILLLFERAEATRLQLLPGSRHRLGRVLWSLGSYWSQQSSLLESNVGLQLMSEGALDMGDEQAAERTDKALEEALDLQRASDQAAPERWPLPSLWEEVLEARARDEWAHVREFTAAARAP